jgi:hypothetical protein
MKKQRDFCQSCGMPLDKDPQHGGTNSDGSLSSIYCSYCYQDGEFTWSGTVKDFQEFCRRQMVQTGHNPILAWLLTRGMKRLGRWRNS